MIPVYISSATSFQLLSFDDPGVYQDQGVDFEATLVSASIEATSTGMAAKLRRLTQAIQVGITASVDLTPIVDGSEIVGDSLQMGFDSALDGQFPVIASDLARMCQTFRVKVSVLSHAGECSLGPATQWVIPRRSKR